MKSCQGIWALKFIRSSLFVMISLALQSAVGASDIKLRSDVKLRSEKGYFPRFSPINPCVKSLMESPLVQIENVIAGPLDREDLINQNWTGTGTGTDIGTSPETNFENKYYRVVFRYDYEEAGLKTIVRRPETVLASPLSPPYKKIYQSAQQAVVAGHAAHLKIIERLVGVATGAMAERRHWDVSRLQKLAFDYMENSTYIEVVDQSGKTRGTLRIINAPYGSTRQSEERLGFHGPTVIKSYFSAEDEQHYMHHLTNLRSQKDHRVGNVYGRIGYLGLMVLGGAPVPPWILDLEKRALPLPRLMMEQIHSENLVSHFAGGLLPRPISYVVGYGEQLFGAGEIEEYGNFYIDPSSSPDVFLLLLNQLFMIQFEGHFMPNMTFKGRRIYTYGDELSWRFYRPLGFKKLLDMPFDYSGRPHWYFYTDLESFYQNFLKIRDRSPLGSGSALALRAALIEAATRLMEEPEAWLN
ncbi:MAG: hypothetical protein IPJ71_11890 [Bdellovibrionales bacterium]|nr:hypothetical protein [Bdellovibrionales bacterium]